MSLRCNLLSSGDKVFNPVLTAFICLILFYLFANVLRSKVKNLIENSHAFFRTGSLLVLQCKLNNDVPGVSMRYPSDILEIPCVSSESETKKDIFVTSQGRLSEVTGTF